MTLVDFEPAAQSMADIVAGIPDDLLDRPTPCPAYRLGDLLDHIATFVTVFTAVAVKDLEVGSQPPTGDASQLAGDWRERIPRDLEALVASWRDPDAWTGMTRAGGVDLPGELAGLIALDELVVHAWDLARASGQTYDVDRPTLEVVRGFLLQFAESEQNEIRDNIFGPAVDVPEDAALIDQVVGLTGRDPAWSPS